MRKTFVALIFTLALSLVVGVFAQEVPTAAEAPSSDPTIETNHNEEIPTVETLVNTGKEEHNKEETKPEIAPPVISSDPMKIEEIASLIFFDIEKESAYSFAAQSENVIIKEITGTVTVLAEHENGIHELHISVPELNNDFCFDCIQPFSYELGDTAIVYVVIQAQT